MDVILTKYGHVSKIEKKKGYPFECFWPILKSSFRRSYSFFGPNMGMTAEGLSCKIRKKMTLEHHVFERTDIFFIKYRHGKSGFFLEKGRFVNKI